MNSGELVLCSKYVCKNPPPLFGRCLQDAPEKTFIFILVNIVLKFQTHTLLVKNIGEFHEYFQKKILLLSQKKTISKKGEILIHP